MDNILHPPVGTATIVTMYIIKSYDATTLNMINYCTMNTINYCVQS